MTDIGLAHRRAAFIEAYMVTGNATEAAKMAGYSERTAYSQGQRLLKKVEVQSVLQARRREVRTETSVSLERLTQELLEILELAKRSKNFYAANAAVMNLAKLHGLLKRKSDQRNIHTVTLVLNANS